MEKSYLSRLHNVENVENRCLRRTFARGYEQPHVERKPASEGLNLMQNSVRLH